MMTALLGQRFLPASNGEQATLRQQEATNNDSLNSSADSGEEEAELGQHKQNYEDVTQGMQGQVEH